LEQVRLSGGDVTAFWSFFNRHGFLGQLLGMGIFILYFPPFIAWFGSHVILWGLHSMVFGEFNDSPTSRFWSNVPFFGSLAVTAVAVLWWTFALLRALAHAMVS
jgi:ABC-type glucose/galactose transport system permease subunit